MNVRVLVVEDDPSARSIIRRVLLRDFGITCLEADDGATALECVLNERVDLVLLDVSLPVLDGLATLEALRRSPQHKDLRVVMLTGNAQAARVLRAKELGVLDYLVKPLSPTKLRERLLQILDGFHDASSSEGPAPLHLARTDRVLVIDESPELRTLVRQQFSLCEVEEVDSDLAALKTCRVRSPQVVVIGQTNGLIDTNVCIGAIRASVRQGTVHVVAAVPSVSLADVRETSPADFVVVRSFDPRTWATAVRQLVDAETWERMLLAPSGCCTLVLRESVAKLLAGLGESRVREHDGEEPSMTGVDDRAVVATISLSGPALSWELVVRIPFAPALSLAAAHFAVSIDEVGDELLTLWATSTALKLAQDVANETRSLGVPYRVGSPSATIERTRRERRKRSGGIAAWWASASHVCVLSSTVKETAPHRAWAVA